MVRREVGFICGAALIVALGCTDAAAQRPAAWDTRVRNPAPAVVEPQDSKPAPDQKAQNKKATDTAGGGKAKRPKAN
jgi:hypothetical protein